MAKARSENIKTPECRLSFASGLFKPRAATEGGPKRYGCTLIFPNSARAELEKAVIQVITDEWGPKGLEKAKAGLIKSPFLKGDGKEARNKTTGELHPGMGPDVFFLRPHAGEDRAPLVRWKDPNVQETEDAVYSGCFGKAVINFFAWEHPSNGAGISAGIAFFQKLREGERLGGGGAVDASRFMEKVEDDTPLPDSVNAGGGASGLFG